MNNNGNPAKEKIIKTAYAHLDNVTLSPKNEETITAFLQQLAAEGLSKDRQSKYIYSLINISRRINHKDFYKLKKQDIVKLIGDINNTNFSEWTKRDYRIILKRLIKYCREQEGKTFKEKEYPPEVAWLSSSIKKKEKKKYHKEVLTPEDVKKLAASTYNLRDKAFILFLYESGARIGEVLNLRIKDFQPEDRYAKVTLFGKTGERSIAIYSSAPAISNWIKHHPVQNDKENWLFCSINHANQGDQGQYFYFNKLLKQAQKRAGLNKPVNPHHFRHSRASELAKKLTEAHLCNYMGWEIGSKEAADYVHTSRDATNKAYLAMHGLVKEEEEKDKFQPVECPRCGIMNEVGAKSCRGCTLLLDEQSIIEYDEQKEQAAKFGFDMQKLIDNPDFRTAIMNIMAEEREKKN